MDLAVLIILIVVVVILLKDIKWVTYLIGILEIFLRLVHYIGDKLGISEINDFINRIFPTSLFGLLSNYTSGIVYEIFSWILVVFLVWFLIYLLNYLFKGK